MSPPTLQTVPKLLLSLLALALLILPTFGADDGWIPLFDGKSLDGWTANENPETFTVKDGDLIAHGDRSHLFYTGSVQDHDFKNFELKTEIMTKPGSNSGVYFHTQFQPEGFPAKGYEIQVNNTHSDPKKTAGIYAVQDNYKAPAKDNEWFTLTIRVEGKHIVTKVNDQVISDYIEEENPKREATMKQRLISHGTFALQGHDPNSEVHYKNIAVKPLP